jgi:phage terminase large subunit
MGSDRFTAHVLDNTTGRQVAVLKHQFDEVLYARQLYCLGWYYNRALLAPETNFSTFPVQELTRLDYPNLYRREVPDTFTGAVRDAYGFATTAKTRPAVIAGLVAVMLEAPELVVDFDTLGEMLTFVYDENRRAAAAPGEHDDLVMALAIAHAVRPWQSQRDAEVTAAPAGKLIDKLEKGKKRR